MPLEPLPGVPAIPQPSGTTESLQVTAVALKQAVENMSGQTGDALDRVVTIRDLIRMQLLSVPDAAAPSSSRRSRPGFLTEVDLREIRTRLSALDGLPP